MKKLALLFHSRITHYIEQNTPRIMGVAPKSGLVPALISAVLLLALMAYFLSEATSR